MEEGETISLPDGRQLGYLIVGKGKPVFFFHAHPGSRLEVLLLKGVATSKHLQIVAVDRPGFGLSTFALKRRICDFASHVSFLADHLEIDKFTLVGLSGGGHYVITCAALLAERVTRAMVISGLSLPLDTSGMPRMNKMFWTLGTKPIIGTWIQKKARNMSFEMAKDPDAFMKSKAGRNFLETLPEDDAKFYTSSSDSRDVLLRSMVEAYRQGSNSIRAMIQEMKLIKKGWDVDLSEIPYGLVHVWHGTADKNVPVRNAYKNVEAISGVHLEIFENAGHLLVLRNLEKLGEILSS